MQRRTALSLVVSSLVWSAAAQNVPAPVPVSGPEQAQWLNWVIPLPKQIAIGSKVELPASEVKVTLRQNAGDVEQSAAAEVLSLLKAKAGVDGSKGGFEILIGACDAQGKVADVTVADAAQLTKLPNAEQAYLIRPVGENRLVLTALDERGVYYAALTLCQLLESKFADGKVTIPLAAVMDWPDLAERGLWGGNAPTDTEWMSAHKLNLAEVHCQPSVAPDGNGHAVFKQELIEAGRLHALKMVPIIHHLDQLEGTDIFRVFPDLRGVGPKARLSDSLQSICYSKPQSAKLLGQWMTELAQQPHVTDLCVWLSEDPGQCACEQCAAAKTPQHVLEAKACIAAWREACKVNPGMKLRLLLTQGTYAVNDQVLAAAPPEVNISYYDGGRTYDSSRDPMIYPLLENFAKGGRWLGVYPQLISAWRVVCPWSAPQFVKYRMTEFVDKKLTNLCGYATPNNRLYDFTVTAAAEWSWNAHGRDERQFATAWATRRGLSDPAKAAEWALTLGDVGWDVYGSGVPYPHFFGNAARMIHDRAKPVLGKGMYRYFDSEAKLEAGVQACQKAAGLAAELNFPEITAETQVIRGYMTMISEMYRIAGFVSRTTLPSDAERMELQRMLTAFATAGAQTSAGLSAWADACLAGSGGSRLGDTLDITDKTVAAVSDALAPFGVRNPLFPFLVKQIGTWQDRDFEEKQAITKTWEVTQSVLGPGTYQVRPVYTKGWNGLNTGRVALATAPKGQSEPLTVVAEDKHTAFSGAQPKDDLYTLQLPAYDENLGYFIVADINGTKSSDKPENRRGCNGIFNLWKVRPPGEAVQDLPLLPMSDAEKSRYAGPTFAKGGLRVGVIQGGYGAEAMLRFLQGKDGLDTQPVFLAGAQYFKTCQVLILAQPYAPETFTPQVATLLTQFVQNGGGVITTHNSVGFKGLPVLLPEICAKGVNNVRDGTFKVPGDHPITKGLPQGQALKESYYDYITLQPGPAATVVAQGVAAGEPVVVCGAAGKGRYVACGLGVCINVGDDKDCAPTPDEGTLLENAVRWAGESH
ncbi:MAG: hypothetical protein A3K19_31985 [Lentisphaerae bacterium RIFOXYB12_FULL_65_16]|nr:MAG: hypothetical protein A3K18_10765 [Lentisphaerae bacterium RIFOXYA12_64_32]OGV88722.1 MAG: hypothetical protein A3K19_31985 [Lentisphaerae bacterium RIFOXYB12_FULL_65_16]